MKRNIGLLLGIWLFAMAGGVIGAAASDRLSAIFNVGQGAAGAKAMVFDSGNGSSNAQVGSTASTNMSMKVNSSTPLSLNSGQILAADSLAAAPAFSLQSDATTGFYRLAAGKYGFSSSGTGYIGFASTLSVPDGAVGTPGINFFNDGDTGIYRGASNEVDVSAGGTQILQINSTGLNIGGTGGVASGSNDYMKWQIFTGSLPAFNSCSGTCTSGVCGTTCPTITGTIRAAMGWTSFNGTSFRNYFGSTMNQACGATADGIYVDGGSTGSILSLINCDTNSTNTYSAIIFYQ